MTACDDSQTRLVDYHYGELAPDARAVLAAHLAECGPCATEYCRLHAALVEVADAGRASPGAEVRARLRGAVAARFRRSWWSRLGGAIRRPIPVYQAALIAALVLGVTVLASTFGRRGADGISPPPARSAPTLSPAVGSPIRPLLPSYDGARLSDVAANVL